MQSNESNNKAIILSVGGQIITSLTYRDVYNLCNQISQFISSHVIKKHQCLGLKMSHNVYIPAIILSLQEMQHSFIFFPEDENETEEITQKLNLAWTLYIDISGKNKISLPLNDCDNLVLEQNVGINELQTYENISYIIRTSGTTGESKFVRVEKYSIESNITCLSRIFNISPDDIIYFGTPLTFDPSMVELFLALRNGACLLITDAINKINLYYLYKTLFNTDYRVTVMQTVPSLFLGWSQDIISKILLNTSLRILAFGGECFPTNILNFSRHENLRIFNLYGVTEISSWATIHEITEISEKVPLGVPLDDTIVEIRDNSGKKLTQGEGEIYIGSISRICLLEGEEKHFENPVFRSTGDVGFIDGEKIYYTGRKNQVVKRLGHKINLSKIEEIVFNEISFQNKCVWCKSDSKLLLFLIKDNIDLSIKDKILDKVRIKLLHTLPKHCYPDYIDIVRKCPVTSHGKIDKQSLELFYLNRTSASRDSTDIFKTMICKYFGLNDRDLHNLQKQTFFEIGGNSILAIQFISELEQETGSPCPPELLTALFEKSLRNCLELACLPNKIKKRKINYETGKSNFIQKIESCVKFEVVWKYNLEACVDSSPLIFEAKGRVYVAVGSFSHIFAVLDVNTGSKVAKYILPDTLEACACFSMYLNFLYVGCFDGNLYCLDFLNDKIEWSYSTGDKIKCTPLLYQKTASVIFGSYDKYIHCVRDVDGTLNWKTNVEESVTSTPVSMEDRIFVATIGGTCVCLNVTNGEVLWKYRSRVPIFGAPCIFQNNILWPKVQGSVLCLSSDGSKLWEFSCNGHLYTSPIVYENMIICACHNGNFYFIDVSGPVPETELIVNLNDSLTTPCIFEGSLLVAGSSGNLFLVNRKCELMADFQFSASVFSSPKAHDKKVYVGCRDNNLYCIEMRSIKKNC